MKGMMWGGQMGRRGMEGSGKDKNGARGRLGRRREGGGQLVRKEMRRWLLRQGVQNRKKGRTLKHRNKEMMKEWRRWEKPNLGGLEWEGGGVKEERQNNHSTHRVLRYALYWLRWWRKMQTLSYECISRCWRVQWDKGLTYYLRWGDYVLPELVCSSICLFVRNITLTVANAFWWNFKASSAMIKGATDYVMGVITVFLTMPYESNELPWWTSALSASVGSGRPTQQAAH